MNRALRLLTSPGLWIPLVIAGPILWALLPGGMPNTADGLVHFTRSAEMVHAWQEGVLVPRWSENLGLGYGIPLFIYAPPLPYFLTAAAHTMFGLPLDTAYKVMMVVAILTAAYGAYRLGAALLGVWAGSVSCAAFLYAPIMLRELFIQGNIAQYLAWSFAPWAAWAVIRIYAEASPRRRTGYALALACAVMGTLLSHNAAALLLSGMTATLAIFLLVATRRFSPMLTTVGGGMLGLGLSAWFWAPALLEGKYVALDRIVASDFRSRFIALRELVALSPRLDSGAINPYVPLTLGAVQVWLGAAGAILFLLYLVLDWRAASKKQVGADMDAVLGATGIFFILFAAFCAYMATAWSEPVWSVLPFVDLFEWPFRWHGFTALGLAWLCAFAVYAPRRLGLRADGIAALVAVVLLMGSAVVNLYPQKLAAGRPYSPAEVVRFESKTNAIGTTSLGEFNPIWVEGAFNTSPFVEDYRNGVSIDRLKNALPAGATGEQTYSGVHRQEFSVDLPEQATLTLDLLYFPGWRARIDGVPVAISPHPGNGLIDIDVPAGKHLLVLNFGGTPLRRAAGTISVLAWIVLAAAGVALVRPLSHVPADSRGAQHAGTSAIYGMAGVSAAIILFAAAQPGLFRFHSPPDTALPAHQPVHVDFADEIRLLGVDLPGDVVRPGSNLAVVAYLRALRSLDNDYTIFLHLDDAVSGETIATVDISHPGGIPTSDWATGLYVRSPLQLTVPLDSDPIQYVLHLGFYNSATGDLLPLQDGSGDLYEVGRIWVASTDTIRPPAGPIARFDAGDAEIELLGAELKDGELYLYWRSSERVSGNYSVFVHLVDEEGTTIGQLDGAPYSNRYPTSAWRPGQVITDRRPIDPADLSTGAIDRVAIGLYNPVDGTRLPAYDTQGNALVDNTLIIPILSER
jgi:hypothetical protein